MEAVMKAVMEAVMKTVMIAISLVQTATNLVIATATALVIATATNLATPLATPAAPAIPSKDPSVGGLMLVSSVCAIQVEALRRIRAPCIAIPAITNTFRWYFSAFRRGSSMIARNVRTARGSNCLIGCLALSCFLRSRIVLAARPSAPKLPPRLPRPI